MHGDHCWIGTRRSRPEFGGQSPAGWHAVFENIAIWLGLPFTLVVPSGLATQRPEQSMVRENDVPEPCGLGHVNLGLRQCLVSAPRDDGPVHTVRSFGTLVGIVSTDASRGAGDGGKRAIHRETTSDRTSGIAGDRGCACQG